jgi:hypothetical protein
MSCKDRPLEALVILVLWVYDSLLVVGVCRFCHYIWNSRENQKVQRGNLRSPKNRSPCNSLFSLLHIQGNRKTRPSRIFQFPCNFLHRENRQIQTVPIVIFFPVFFFTAKIINTRPSRIFQFPCNFLHRENRETQTVSIVIFFPVFFLQPKS